MQHGWNMLSTASDERVLNILNGLAFGFRGSYAVTDCSTYMAAFTDSLLDVGRAVAEISSTGTVIAPFVRSQTAMVAQSNVNSACQTTAIATQLNIRFNTASGLADLAYTIYNVAKEGFFTGLYDDSITNAIWTNTYKLWQGTWGRHSMSCTDVGFYMGTVIQALISFQVPDTIETGNVNGGDVPDV